MNLMCYESSDAIANIIEDDAIEAGGLMSIADPAIIKDDRILRNLLFEKSSRRPIIAVNYFVDCHIESQIKPHMRYIVAKWMLEVCEEQRCQSGVFSLALNYMDRFLTLVSIRKNQFQLLACVAMLIASKFKESDSLCTDKLVIYSDFSVTAREITSWEVYVLDVLKWDISVVTVQSILDQLILRFLSHAPNTSEVVHVSKILNVVSIRQHAETYAAITATNFEFCRKFSPSVAAVSCLTAALEATKVEYSSDEFRQRINQVVLDSLLTFTGFSLQEVKHVESVILSCMLSERLKGDINHRLSSPTSQPQSQPVVSSKVCSSNGVETSTVDPCGENRTATTGTPTDMLEVSSTFVC